MEECGSDCVCGIEPGQRRRALRLSYFTVAYNIFEGLFSVFFGLLAGSIALVSFGMDSFIESLSGGVMIWRFRPHSSTTREREEHLEHTASRLVAASLLVLAAYVVYESANKLRLGDEPDPSIPGMAITIISLTVMPLLFVEKRRTSTAVRSRSLLADARQTLACMMLSVAVLLGLSMNFLFGLWQADPAAGLVIAAFLAREGVRTYREGELCEC